MAKGKIHSNTATLEKENLVTASPVAETANKRQGKHSTKALGMIAGSLLLCTLVNVAHYRVASIGEDYTGILAPLDRLFDLLFTLLLVGLMFTVGRVVCRWLSLAFISVTEEAAFSILLGTGIVGSLLFVLGVSHLFRPLPVSLLFVFLIAFTYKEAVRLYEIVTHLVSCLKVKEQRIVLLLFVALVLLLTLRAGLPPYAVDEAMYHLAVPKEFVQAGRIFPLYDNFSGNMPFLPQMIYVVCLLAKADSAARLFSLALAVATAISLYGFCARFLNRATSVIALFGFFGAGMITEVAITTRVDVTLAGMLFVAAYAMMNYFETERRGWLWLSALLSGFALGIKYTAAAWITLMGVMYLYESFRKRQKITLILTRGIIFTILTLAVASPWLIKSYVYFKNPVYPFGTGEVADYDASGVRYFTASDEQKMDAWFEQSRSEFPQAVANIEALMVEAGTKRMERNPFKFWEFYFNSDKFNMGLAEAYQDPNYLFLLVPLLFFLPRRRWLNWWLIFAILFFVFVAMTSWIARYYLPIYPALTLLAAYSLTGIADKLRYKSAIARVLPALAVATTVCLTAFIFAVQIYVSGTVSYWAGTLSRRDFLQGAFYYPAIDYINHNTPSTAGVMLIGAQMGYHLERKYLAEAGWDSVEWQRLLLRHNSLQEITEDLRGQGIQYILFSPGLFKFIAYMGREGSGPSGTMYTSTSKNRQDYYVQTRNWATFELYRSKYLELVQEFPNTNKDIEYKLYKIRSTQ